MVTLTPDNFEDEVTNSDRDIMVEFYGKLVILMMVHALHVFLQLLGVGTARVSSQSTIRHQTS